MCLDYNILARFRNHRKQCVPFYCCHTYVGVNSIMSTESVVMETQQCVPFIVVLHSSLPTIRNEHRSSCEMTAILFDFNEMLSSSTCFHKSYHYQISRKSVQRERRWYMRPDGHEANRRFSQLCDSAYKRNLNSPDFHPKGERHINCVWEITVGIAGDWINCYVVCTLYQILLGWSNREGMVNGAHSMFWRWRIRKKLVQSKILKIHM